MRARQGWLTRPLAFLLCLGCGVAVAVVLIEALRPYGGASQPPPSGYLAAPAAARSQAPFPRVLGDARGNTLVIPHKPQRIVSHTLGTDEIVLALCDPQRIAALSVLVDDARYSNATAPAQHVQGRAGADAEQTLRFRPDVIFVASYSKAELVELLRAAHAPVVRFTQFDRLDDIKANIRTIGYVLGEDDKAEALVQQMEHDMARIQAGTPRDTPPVRVMLYGQAGVTAGAHTTFDDMVRAVGAANVAAEQGVTGFRNVSSEQLTRWNPDVIVTSGDPDALAEARHSLLQDPAVAVTRAGKSRRVIVLPGRLFSTVTHHITQGIAQLAQELYQWQP